MTTALEARLRKVERALQENPIHDDLKAAGWERVGKTLDQADVLYLLAVFDELEGLGTKSEEGLGFEEVVELLKSLGYDYLGEDLPGAEYETEKILVNGLYRRFRRDVSGLKEEES